MKIKKITVGQVATNVYTATKGNDVIFVDPGAEFSRIDNMLEAGDNVIGIILTHGHFDHIGAVNELVEKYGCAVYAPLAEANLINNPKQSFYDGKPLEDIIYVDDNFNIGPFSIKLHKTPGHTAGSVTYEIDDVMFTGDTLMNLTVGRQDLPTGSEADMYNSIQYYKTFKNDYKIYCGHGNDSTLFYQFEKNPYFK
ncbi:MAG: MBL fold metallo-hydrolase [Erysipelothrix sp.]|nr:MBL fold metallo-hydrolase [Erysipelothrix sp.]